MLQEVIYKKWSTRSDEQIEKTIGEIRSYSNQDGTSSQPRTAPPPSERASLTPFQELTHRSLSYERVHCTME